MINGGETGRKVLPIQEYFLLMTAVVAISLPFVLLSMYLHAFRKWYLSQLKDREGDFATSLEAWGLLTMDDSHAEFH